MSKFITPAAYKVKDMAEALEIEQELIKLGYKDGSSNRCLSVDNQYKVILHNGAYGNTLIEFQHK